MAYSVPTTKSDARSALSDPDRLKDLASADTRTLDFILEMAQLTKTEMEAWQQGMGALLKGSLSTYRVPENGTPNDEPLGRGANSRGLGSIPDDVSTKTNVDGKDTKQAPAAIIGGAVADTKRVAASSVSTQSGIVELPDTKEYPYVATTPDNRHFCFSRHARYPDRTDLTFWLRDSVGNGDSIPGLGRLIRVTVTDTNYYPVLKPEREFVMAPDRKEYPWVATNTTTEKAVCFTRTSTCPGRANLRFWFRDSLGPDIVIPASKHGVDGDYARLDVASVANGSESDTIYCTDCHRSHHMHRVGERFSANESKWWSVLSALSPLHSRDIPVASYSGRSSLCLGSHVVTPNSTYSYLYWKSTAVNAICIAGSAVALITWMGKSLSKKPVAVVESGW